MLQFWSMIIDWYWYKLIIENCTIRTKEIFNIIWPENSVIFLRELNKLSLQAEIYQSIKENKRTINLLAGCLLGLWIYHYLSVILHLVVNPSSKFNSSIKVFGLRSHAGRAASAPNNFHFCCCFCSCCCIHIFSAFL